MSNSCNSCNGQSYNPGCCLMNSFANAINNLFSPAPYCSSCQRNNPVAFTNGFVDGVNAANQIYALGNTGNNGNTGCGCGNNGNTGCGCGNNGVSTIGNTNGTGCGCGNNNGSCGCGCGGTGDLSGYTGCCNRCYDAYYAQQYALGPFSQTATCPCNS